MKMNELKKEFKDLDAVGLQSRIEKERKELFQLRVSAATSHVKDCSLYKKKRKAIAQLMTYLRSTQPVRGSRL